MYQSESEVAQSYPTLCDPMECSPPGSSIHGILQARTLEWVAIAFSNAWKWKVKSESEVAQSCPTPSDPMDCSPPGSSIHGIFQARVLEWGAIAFSENVPRTMINRQRLINSVQFSRLVVSTLCDPHGLQHARLPCPSSTPRAYSNSCARSQWCHPTISSSVVPFSSRLQSFPASRYFSMSQFFASGVLEFLLQHPSFQWIIRTDFL